MIRRTVGTVVFVLVLLGLPLRAGAAVTVTVDPSVAGAGGSVTVSGTADPHAWVTVKAVNTAGDILFLDSTPAAADGAYRMTLTVPAAAPDETLTFVVGYGNDVAVTELIVRGTDGGGDGNGGGGHSRGGGSSTPLNYASKLIEAGEGGGVRFGNAAVEVPAGALPADATLKVKQLTEEEAGNLVPSGLRVKLGSDVYEITTTGGRDFGDKTVTIRIAYDPAKIAEGERPVIRYRDETTGQWVDLPTTVERGADGRWYAVTQVNHLTRFAVFSAPAQEKVKKVIVLTLGRRDAAVDGQPYTLDAPPFVDTKANRTLVPLRFVGEALGAKVDWNAETRQITITGGGKAIVLTIGSAGALVDGRTTALDSAPAVLPPGRTFVPLRFVGEALGATVDYGAGAGQITITR